MSFESLCLLIVLAPLTAAVVAGLGGRLIGRAGAHTICIAGVTLSFAASAWILERMLDGAPVFNQAVYTWGVSDGLRMEIGFLIDNLSALMMTVVTFVSLAVHVYTIGYMRDDPGYQRFFAYISLFTFAMLMLVMSNNFLQLFFGWEARGTRVVPADRLLVQAADGDLRELQGIHRQSHRRLRDSSSRSPSSSRTWAASTTSRSSSAFRVRSGTTST